jgi:hypothetical protein
MKRHMPNQTLQWSRRALRSAAKVNGFGTVLRSPDTPT